MAKRSKRTKHPKPPKSRPKKILATTAKVEHVVVLMLENRSFDSLLGYATGLATDHLSGSETIPDDPGSLNPTPVPVTPNATYRAPDPDPGHDIDRVSVQMYGRKDLTFPAGGTNNGFVLDYAKDSTAPGTIMDCFSPDKVPALVELAAQFVVCDRWFASMPGPTWPNRLFAHAATAGGHVANDLPFFSMPTIYDRLEQKFGSAQDTWAIYYHDIPQSIVFWSLLLRFLLAPFNQRYRLFSAFAGDVAAGRLPRYTFIEPQYYSYVGAGNVVDEANDQHPSHDVALGDHLIADVYETLRNSSYWDKTLLIVTWDEHGGTYDHVFPDTPTVSPDGLSMLPFFKFTRLGCRVPAVVVSPWLDAGVDHCVRDHTAILATVEQCFGLQPLTARDQWVADPTRCRSDLLPLLTRSTLRSNAPVQLPRAQLAAATARARRVGAPARRRDRALAARVRATPLSPLQRRLVELAQFLDWPGQTAWARGPRRRAAPRMEDEGADLVRKTMQQLRAAAAAAAKRAQGGRRRR
jgi:phospholipase C